MTKYLSMTLLLLVAFNAAAQLPMKTEAELEFYPTYRSFKAPVDSVYKMTIENPGVLPDDFDKYKFLQKLCFFGNDWDYEFFQLPAYFYSFENLTHLSIANTDLTSISKGISKFENLQCLSVANNNLIALPNDLSDIEGFRSLTIDNNIKKIPVLPTLTELVIYFETNVGDDSGAIPEGITDCRKIRYLTINSEATLVNLNEMISIIKALPALEKLTWIDPNLDDEQIKALSGIKKITELNLPSIQLDPDIMAGYGHLKRFSFGSYLEDKPEKRKKFWENILAWKDLEEVSTTFYMPDTVYYRQLKKLNLTLDLGVGLKDQCAVLKDMPSLNRITLPGSASLPSNLTEMKTLKEIDVTDLLSVDISIIFGYLMVIPSLEKIIISNDQLTKFPQETVKLVRIKEMEIYNVEHGVYMAIPEKEKARARKLLPNCKFVYNEMF